MELSTAFVFSNFRKSEPYGTVASGLLRAEARWSEDLAWGFPAAHGSGSYGDLELDESKDLGRWPQRLAH